MNKQALAFFSMFTLVLMLSIYYVSLEPIPTTNTNQNEVNSVMLLMQEQIDEEKEVLLMNLKQQLASTTISELKKKEILNQIDEIDKNKKTEEKIATELTKQNIKSIIEIKNNIVNITVFELEKSSKKAEEIMSLAYKLISKNQTIELIFS